MSSSSARLLILGALGSLGVAILWTILAALNPTTNYHLSPLVAVLAAPAAARLANSGRLRGLLAVATVAVGIVVTVAAATAIHAAGWALGPSFSSSVPPLAELAAVIMVGALVGAVVAITSFGRNTDSQEPAESEATNSRSSSTDH